MLKFLKRKFVRVRPVPLSEEELKRIGEFDGKDPVLRAPLHVAEAMLEQMMNNTAQADPRMPGFEQAVVRAAGYTAACVEFEVRWSRLVEDGGRAKEEKATAEAGGKGEKEKEEGEGA